MLYVAESCVGRCDEDPNDVPDDGCYCDYECLDFEGCCHDFKTVCEDTMANNGLNKSEFQFFYNNVFLFSRAVVNSIALSMEIFEGKDSLYLTVFEMFQCSDWFTQWSHEIK